MTRLASEKILEVEDILRSLTDEMLKLKSATKNYEETKENLQDICESLDRISVTHQKLTDNMTQFLAEIKKMNYRQQTDKILQQGETQSKALGDLITKQADKILQNHENQSDALGDEFREQTARILQNNESQSRELRDLTTKQTDKILQNNENQSKTLRLVKYLIALGVLMEAIVIILIIRVLFFG